MANIAVRIKEPIWVYQGDAFVAALPAPEARFTYGNFDLQQLATSGTAGCRFESRGCKIISPSGEIAPARTLV